MEAVGMGYVLALIGMGLMVGLPGAGSGIGFGLVGPASLGAIKKKPEVFGSCLVLSAIPSTNGLYGFVAFIMYNGMLAGMDTVTLAQGGVILGAGITVGLACMITCIGQAKIAASGIVGMGSGYNVFGNTMILAAYPEFYAILSLVAAILLMPVIQLPALAG
jgi:V/A-type H+-transporting ATPase subunit K